MEVRERSQVKRDSCDSFGISAQGLLSKVDRMESDVEGLIVRRIMQWWSQALPTRLHRAQPHACGFQSNLMEFAKAGANTELA